MHTKQIGFFPSVNRKATGSNGHDTIFNRHDSYPVRFGIVVYAFFSFFLFFFWKYQINAMRYDVLNPFRKPSVFGAKRKTVVNEAAPFRAAHQPGRNGHREPCLSAHLSFRHPIFSSPLGISLDLFHSMPLGKHVPERKPRELPRKILPCPQMLTLWMSSLNRAPAPLVEFRLADTY